MSRSRKNKKKIKKAIVAPEGVPLPAHIAEEIRGTLIGQLQLKLWERITGQKNHAPIYKQILRYLRTTSLTTPAAGEIDHTILYGKKFSKAFEELPSVDNIAKLLEQLEDAPWHGFRYLELCECPPPLPATLGIAASSSTLLLPGGGRVYVITFLDQDYPARVGRVEIRASRANPDHTFSMRTPEGWKVCDPDEPQIELALRCLAALSTAEPPSDLKYLPMGAEPPAPLAPEPETPPDPEYDRRLQLVHDRQMPCTLVRVPLAQVRPYSAEFAFDTPRTTVDRMAAELRRGVSAHMLLYWKAPSFIVSDDYALYLAERELRKETIEAVVMGEVPAALADAVVRRGGPELIPGALYMQEDGYSAAYLEWLEKYRLANKQASHELIRLHLLYIELASLLRQPKIPEREFQRFIESHPVVLDAYGGEVRSEVRLGKSYRMDLVLQYAESDRRILLVELESPTLALFTAEGRWNAKVTHAIQQVQDWMRWWREHPQDVPAPFDATIPVKGLVIAGRDRDLDESAKRRLLHNNHQFHDLSVVTYDDLLRRLDRLMAALGF
ncbi:Shedu immune nuclease family protein [Peristeroidobacter agariperforans]|uniref:Shedu immune nuclease family protein n=1 Tax=Peristeroidobacter agariperforans TaxID=268404 RepID=UPI001300A9CF|nr:Shedu immune nuclease family protein [Peristeroidobacter agariperforans]